MHSLRFSMSDYRMQDSITNVPPIRSRRILIYPSLTKVKLGKGKEARMDEEAKKLWLE